jgi:hypothetical protein
MVLRNLLYAILICCIWILFLSGESSLSAQSQRQDPAYTTDSELAPEELSMWEVVYLSKLDRAGRYYMVAEHPDLRLPLECSIPYVLVRSHAELKNLTGYAYYKYGRLYIFEINGEQHFEQVKITRYKKWVIDHFLKPFLDAMPEDKKREGI